MEEQQARFKELFDKNWKFLSAPERKEYLRLKKELNVTFPPRTKDPKQKARLDEIAKRNSLPLPETDIPTFEAKKAVLFNCFGLISDADDKGRLNAVITDDEFLRSSNMDQVYTRALWLVQDGDSRRAIKNLFNRE